MRLVNKDVTKGRNRLDLTQDERVFLDTRLRTEISDALSVRRIQERRWLQANRSYESIPGTRMRTHPIEVPIIEVPLGASAVDSIYAQSLDLIWQPKPTLVVRPEDGSRWQNHAEATQKFANYITHSELNLRAASNDAILSDVKLGTGVLATFWTERIRNTMTSRVVDRGPVTTSVPIEDFIVPGGISELHTSDWVCMRTWLTAGEMLERRERRGWDLSNAQPTAQSSQVRSTRERLAGTHQSYQRRSDVFQIGTIFAQMPIDDSGQEFDMLLYYDLTSGNILHAAWNPYNRLPFNAMTYQKREHLFYGIGVMDMSTSYQTAASEFMNEWLMNARLANMRGFIGPPNQFPGDTVKLWAGRYLGVSEPEKVKSFEMADAYNSIPVAIQMIAGFADKRVGANDVSSPKPSAMMGNRTPGVTAITMMQQVNRRFTPAFDQMRFAVAGAVIQGLYRYQERIKGGDKAAEATIRTVLKNRDAELLLEVLKDESFHQQMNLELSASSVSANILQERQDAVALAGVLGQYYEKALELISLASQQGIDPSVRNVAQQVATAMGEVIERTVRKFDQVRDAERFILDIEGAIDSLPDLAPSGVQGLLDRVQGSGGQGGGVPGAGNFPALGPPG